MAGLFFTLSPGGIAVASGVAKSLLMITAPANHRLLLHEFQVSANGVTAADPPAMIQWKVATTSGTFTSLVPAPEQTYAETIQTTAGHTATVEPTMTTIRYSEYMHTQTSTGVIVLKKPIPIEGGTRLALLVTPGTMTGCTVSPWARLEE